jgi:hypothetical protein
MQADEETALSGLEAIGHLRNSTEALANGDLEAAEKGVKAAEELMVDMGLSADMLRSARRTIERSAH